MNLLKVFYVDEILQAEEFILSVSRHDTASKMFHCAKIQKYFNHATNYQIFFLVFMKKEDDAGRPLSKP